MTWGVLQANALLRGGNPLGGTENLSQLKISMVIIYSSFGILKE